MTPKWLLASARKWRVFAHDTNLGIASLLFVICGAIAIAWRSFFPSFERDLWPEMAGIAMDVLLILVVFAGFEHRHSRREAIERQREIIDDFKRWDAAEGRMRIAGAIRRLNRMDVVALSLGGATLSDFSFAEAGIASIADSKFYDGAWGDPLRETRIKLTRVAFDHVDCRRVQFSPFDPFEAFSSSLERYAQLIDCTFVHAVLGGSTFNGADLTWSAPPPTSHYELVDEDDGSPNYAQSSYGPFDGVNLAEVSFRACKFRYADFRGASGIGFADFFRAEGLQEAEFDTPELKAAALASASRPE